MLWKNANRNPSHSGSIENRLALLFTLATMSVLILLTFCSYLVLVDFIMVGAKQYIIDETHIIKTILDREPHNYAALKQEINGVPLALKDASYHYYIRLMNANHTIIMETPDIERVIKSIRFPPLDPLNLSSKIMKWQTTDGKTYLLMIAPVSWDKFENPRLIMQMVFDMTYYQKLIVRYRYYLLVGLIFCLLAVYTLGKLLSRKGLQGLHVITHTTRNITTANLTTRIDAKQWPIELVSLATTINGMLESIETAFTRLSQCTTELAHELRTPIHHLMNETDIILSKHRSMLEYKQAHEANADEFRRLSQMVENILFLARSENPLTCIKKITLYAHNEVQSICDYFQILASEKNITLTVSGKATVIADPLLFRRVISNLIANAIQYSCLDGFVFVTIEQNENHQCSITIRDTGVGIAEEYQSLIFNRFYRIAEHRSKHSTGVGLGLSIVKSIMDLHKGSIKLSSQPNQGTTITLLFSL